LRKTKASADLVVNRGLRVPGLILVRDSQRDLTAVLQRLVAVIAHYGLELRPLFVVITPERTRLRSLKASRGRRRAPSS